MEAENSIFVFDIAKLAVRSILSAASIHPKPGLATPLDNDALDGTDFQRLLDGIMGLFPCFVNCAAIGYETEEMKPDDVMSLLRPVGIQGEQDVLRAACGRLTLKGRVFLPGLLCAAAARLSVQKRNLTPMALALTASSFVRGITENELWGMEDSSQDGETRTDGELAYIRYGMEGCRGEAEKGFPLTLKAANMLRNLADTHGHLSFRERAVHVFLNIMSECADTSLARRVGIDCLFQVQEAARKIIAGGETLTHTGDSALEEMTLDFKKRGISPRGSAAVLSASMFILSLSDMQ